MGRTFTKEAQKGPAVHQVCVIVFARPIPPVGDHGCTSPGQPSGYRNSIYDLVVRAIAGLGLTNLRLQPNYSAGRINMSFRRLFISLLVLCCIGTLAVAQKQVAGTYSTWDADLINSEDVAQTGAGVYVAVLDTGLVPNWSDYLPKDRIATKLGTGFFQPVSFKAKNDVCGLGVTVGQLHQTGFIGSNSSSHGTHVTSTIIGYNYRSNTDLAAGFPLPPIYVRGIAPDVTIIPVKVLGDYQVPALPKCGAGMPAQVANFGTDEMVAAGINYVAGLAKAGYRPIVINMSLGGSELAQIEKDAIDNAIANGVVIVAAAGNAGEAGMHYPGAYAPVISAGAAGWTGEWLFPGTADARYRMWWLKYPFAPLLPGSGEVADPTSIDDVYVTDFSSRALAGQQLDVLAPGSWVRGPFESGDGYSHLPWWSKSLADLINSKLVNFYWVGGTSMATPHVAAVSALMLEKNPSLTAADVENILKSSALIVPATGSRHILDNTVFTTISWDTDCNGTPCDAVGAGLIQADAAIALTP
jgi:subtilisin family serine protease